MNIKIRTLFAFILCACLLVLLGSVPAAHAAETKMRASSDTLAHQTGAAVIYYVYYVVQGGTGDCTTSWATACDLQTALVAAVSGDEIWAAAGVYKPTADPTNRAATFQLKAGVAVYGGFAGTESSRDERDPATHVTILSGDLNGDDGSSFANNGENSYHVVTGASNAILDGVTITAGNANGDPALAQNRGGGMYNRSSSPTLTNVTFNGNQAAGWGGGMYNESSSPTLNNVTFSGNSTMYYGGGMGNESNSRPALNNVTFSGNSSTNYGGGMYNHSSNPTLNNVTFSGNSATSAGGGMYNSASSPTLNNVTFSGNSANGGGGMWNSTSSPTLNNVTFSGNSASGGNGNSGMHNNSYSSPVINNTILWGDAGGEMVNWNSSTPTIISSVVQGGCPAGATCTNIIGTDPLLGALGDYGGATQTIPLLPGSSAIDAGNDGLCPATDQRGVARPQGAHCDIGAFELQIPQAVTLASFDAQAMVDRIQLSWETVSEANNAGFNLYRSASPAAPDALLAYVPSQAPGSTQGASYSFDDTQVSAGQTWYYWLEDVDLNGATSLHGPVSATLQAPTAVTLDALQAQAAAPGSVLTWGALVAALIAAAGVLGVRRRSRAG